MCAMCPSALFVMFHCLRDSAIAEGDRLNVGPRSVVGVSGGGALAIGSDSVSC